MRIIYYYFFCTVDKISNLPGTCGVVEIPSAITSSFNPDNLAVAKAPAALYALKSPTKEVLMRKFYFHSLF